MDMSKKKKKKKKKRNMDLTSESVLPFRKTKNIYQNLSPSV